MKAWTVTDYNGSCSTEIVFAETRGKAKAYAMNWCDSLDGCEWNELRVKRFKEYDQYYTGDANPNLWVDVEHRVRLVRDFGWSCFEVIESFCKDCPARQWCENIYKED